MEKKKEQERLATYVVKVPIQFTFVGKNTLDRDELINACIAELNNRLDNGYFDVLEKELEIPKKVTHYTREELRLNSIRMREIFGV